MAVLPDEIDFVNAGSVGERLVVAIVPGVAVVIADLTVTVFCDCAGVRSLLRAGRRASAVHAELRLVAGARAVLRILELVGADRVRRCTRIWVWRRLPDLRRSGLLRPSAAGSGAAAAGLGAAPYRGG